MSCEHCSGEIADGVCRNCGAPGESPPAVPLSTDGDASELGVARANLAAALREFVAASGEEVEEEVADLGASVLQNLLLGYACDWGPLLGEATFTGSMAVRRRVTGLCRCCLTPLEVDLRVAMRADPGRPARILADDLAAVVDAIAHRLIRPAALADQIVSVVVDVAGASAAEVTVEVTRPCLGCDGVGGVVHVSRGGSWPDVAASAAN